MMWPVVAQNTLSELKFNKIEVSCVSDISNNKCKSGLKKGVGVKTGVNLILFQWILSPKGISSLVCPGRVSPWLLFR